MKYGVVFWGDSIGQGSQTSGRKSRVRKDREDRSFRSWRVMTRVVSFSGQFGFQTDPRAYNGPRGDVTAPGMGWFVCRHYLNRRFLCSIAARSPGYVNGPVSGVPVVADRLVAASPPAVSSEHRAGARDFRSRPPTGSPNAPPTDRYPSCLCGALLSPPLKRT